MKITHEMLNTDIPSPPLEWVDDEPGEMLRKIEAHYRHYAMRNSRRFWRLVVLMEWLPEWLDRDFDRLAELNGEDGANEILARRAAVAIRTLESESAAVYDIIASADRAVCA